MKNLFGINVTQDKDNTVIDGARYVTRRASPGLLQRISDVQDSTAEMQRRVLPPPLRILSGASMAVAFILFFAASLEQLSSVPLSEIHGITRIDKKAAMSQWNKEDDYLSKKYKKYNVGVNKADTYFVKPYFALEIGSEFQILIPNYDIETVAALLHLEIPSV